MGYGYNNKHGNSKYDQHKNQRDKNEEEKQREREIENLINQVMVKEPNWGEIFKDGGILDRYSKKLNIKTTQIRKFFEQVRKIRDKLHEGNVAWKDIESELWKLIPAVKYASGRKVISKDFYYFVSKGIYMATQPNSEEEKRVRLENFIRLFEAVVAFHKFQNPDKGV